MHDRDRQGWFYEKGKPHLLAMTEIIIWYSQSTGNRSSNMLQKINYMKGYQASSSSNGCLVTSNNKHVYAQSFYLELIAWDIGKFALA